MPLSKYQAEEDERSYDLQPRIRNSDIDSLIRSVRIGDSTSGYFDSGRFEPEVSSGFFFTGLPSFSHSLSLSLSGLPTIITSYDEYRDDRPTVGHLRRSKVLRRQMRRESGGRGREEGEGKG